MINFENVESFISFLEELDRIGAINLSDSDLIVDIIDRNKDSGDDFFYEHGMLDLEEYE